MALKKLVPSGSKDVPVRREEYDPFSLLHREMNRLFESFSRGFGIEPPEARLGVFSPSVNVIDEDKEIKVTAELPGMDEKEIDVSLTKDALTITGEKKQEKEDKGKNYYRMERSYGSFSRSVPLPVEIDTAKVKAQFKKGILTVTLPKTAKSLKEKKKIQIKSE